MTVIGAHQSGLADSEISISGVWKAFRQGRGYTSVLEEIDLQVASGEFICLVGPSGCGKSTLLSMMAGLTQPTLGDVTVRGQSGHVGEHGGSAFVFQRDLLLDWRTVLDNVLVGYHLRGESPKPHRARATALLEQVGLGGTENLHPWHLSGGMRQRVAICRALIDDPQVLFMDEPFGALDALTRERLNDDLLKIAAAGRRRKTIVFVTHDVDEAVYLGDRVVVMGAHPGRIVDDISIPAIDRDHFRESPEFSEYSTKVRSALLGAEAVEECVL